MVRLPDGGKSMRIHVTILTEFQHVMDRQTDGQTSCYGIVDAMDMR